MLDLGEATARGSASLARLRDLLPGRYAFGLTGRGRGGDALAAAAGTGSAHRVADRTGAADRGDRAVHDSVTDATRRILAAEIP